MAACPAQKLSLTRPTENEREEADPGGNIEDEHCMEECEKSLSVVRSTSGGAKKELDDYAEHERRGGGGARQLHRRRRWDRGSDRPDKKKKCMRDGGKLLVGKAPFTLYLGIRLGMR